MPLHAMRLPTCASSAVAIHRRLPIATRNAHLPPSALARNSRNVTAAAETSAHPGLHQQLASALLSVGLAATMFAIGVPAANADVVQPPAVVAEANTVEEIPKFKSIIEIGGFALGGQDLDTNKDGIISSSEFMEVGKKLAEIAQADAPTDEDVVAALRQYDLNMDGKITKEELLTCVVYEEASSEENLAYLDDALWTVFDANADGKVDLKEFTGALPQFGVNGDVVKEFVFKRADAFVDGNGSLLREELAAANNILREIVSGGF